MSEEVEDIGVILERIGNNQKQEDLSVYNLMNEWFNPRKSLMKHVIVIQMIACFIVGLFLIVTAGNDLSADSLMGGVLGFMVFVAAAFGVYGKL